VISATLFVRSMGWMGRNGGLGRSGNPHKEKGLEGLSLPAPLPDLTYQPLATTG
jgi:hypothetical protein